MTAAEHKSVVEFLSAAVDHVTRNKVGVGEQRRDFKFRGETCRVKYAPNGIAFVVFVLSKKSGKNLTGASGGEPLCN